MIRAAFPGLVGVLVLTSCLSPTQVTVELSTDACGKQPTTTIAIGAPGKAETATPQTTTTTCDPKTGSIGSIVVTPASDNGATFEIQVVVSVGVDPSHCTAANGFKAADATDTTGCIVARREIAFVPHSPLTLPIELNSACLSTKCKEGETCVVVDNVGTCKSAVCTGPECSVTSAASSSAGVGGAGAGGGGMGGGGAGNLTSCQQQICGSMCDASRCKKVGEGVQFLACERDVERATCTTPCTGKAQCVHTFECDGLGSFACKTPDWNNPEDCPGGTVPVFAGFLGYQVNTCVPSSCGDGCASGEVCIPVHQDCCVNSYGFACVRKQEPCCTDTGCGNITTLGCLYDKGGTLACNACPGIAASRPVDR